MIETLFLAIGLVLIVEGLVYALAPSLVEQLLASMKATPNEQRRIIGVGALAFGLVLVWCAKMLSV